jgi:hypothetical protein
VEREVEMPVEDEYWGVGCGCGCGCLQALGSESRSFWQKHYTLHTAVSLWVCPVAYNHITTATLDIIQRPALYLKHSVSETEFFLLLQGENVLSIDRLCGLVVIISGCRTRGPGFDSRSCQIF